MICPLPDRRNLGAFSAAPRTPTNRRRNAARFGNRLAAAGSHRPNRRIRLLTNFTVCACPEKFVAAIFRPHRSATHRPITLYDVKEVPAATVASTYCRSDDNSAEHAYNALRKWMNVTNYQLAGPKREIYLDEMLEIQFPLKSS